MKHVMIVLIRAYQTLLSPVLPHTCVYTPSCSNYALEAFQRHGFVRGSRLTATRLLRCWPWNGGQDPVPHEVVRKHPERSAQHTGPPASMGCAASGHRGS